MHNLIPIRGAQVRDSLSWSTYIDDAIELFADDTDLMFASHHWPRWGNDDVRGFLARQRDLYRWIHDQTLRLANHGHVATEIAEMLTPPADHYEESHTVGYYGAMVHNVKAVYQRYLSWYDGNPCHLNPHPPVEAGTRYVELAGGADALLASAQAAYDRGDYRWVAELVNHLVFADATNTAARALLADAYEQLGYQSESATFRNAYLMGAQELRHGHPPRNPAANRGLVRALPIDQLLATVAMRLNADDLGGVDLAINLVVSDLDEQLVRRAVAPGAALPHRQAGRRRRCHRHHHPRGADGRWWRASARSTTRSTRATSPSTETPVPCARSSTTSTSSSAVSPSSNPDGDEPTRWGSVGQRGRPTIGSDVGA